MQGWYFDPALKHYCVIKTVTDTGAIILIDNFKFKHHAIKTPTVTPEDRIIKSTKAIALTLQSNNDAPPYELEANTKLQYLILGKNNNGTTKDNTLEPVNLPTTINNAQPYK